LAAEEDAERRTAAAPGVMAAVMADMLCAGGYGGGVVAVGYAPDKCPTTKPTMKHLCYKKWNRIVALAHCLQ